MPKHVVLVPGAATPPSPFHHVVRAGGASLEDVVKTTVYMRDVGEFDAMNQVYGDYFQRGTAPTRVTIQAPSPLLGINVEIG